MSPLRAPTPRACPRCGQPNARWLTFTSTINEVDTYQCLACRHVWMDGAPPPKAERGAPKLAANDPRQQRAALIETIQAQGASLLSVAKEETMKMRIRLAMLHLDNARSWLNQDDVEGQHHVLQIVDSTIDIATRNMATVAKMLDDIR